jgi:hypothetical protein
VDVPSPVPATYEPSHVIQLLVNMQGEIKALCTKTDRLISDVEKLDGHVGKLNTSFHRAWGFAVCAIILIPIMGAILWWLLGGQLTDIKNALLHLPTKP